MKIKKFLSLMLLALVGILLVACGETAEDPAKIAAENADKVAITYATGDSAASVTSDVTLGKVELEGLTIVWSSNNAAITNEGKVTRPAAGEKDVTVKLTVTVTYKDANASKDFELVVKALPEVKPLSVEIQGTDKLVEGAEYTFTVTVLPENASNKAVTWESDNAEVATVGADGKVKAVKAGTANITAKCAANSAVEATFTVTVVEPSADTVEATQAKAAGETGWCKGVVIGVYKQGYLISDGTAAILVYMGKTQFTQVAGDYVEVKGTLAEYRGAKQFTADATVTALTETAPSVEIKAEKLKDAAAVTAFMGAFVLNKKVTMRVTVTGASESYIDCVVKDSQVGVSLTYPMDYTAYTAGKDYDVTGYALYVKNNNNVDTLYVMVDKAIEVDYGFDVKVTYKDGTNENVETINSLLFPIVELPEPEAKEGFVFLGWYTGSEETPVRVYSIDAPVDTTVFTRWVAEADAPIFVDPACEDGSAYTNITDAVAAAKEGQEIVLAPGEYAEEYVTPAERTYPDAAAILAALGADFVAKNKLKEKIEGTDEYQDRTVSESLFETSTAESSWFTTFMDDAELKAKWSWFFKAISEAAENEDLDPEYYTADQRFLMMANLYGFFTGTQHTESYSKATVSADFAKPSLVQQVVLAGPKKNGEDAADTVENKIVLTKAVKITGPNANVHGHSDSRNEEANITSKFVIAANNVVIDGLEFSGDAVIQLGADKAGSQIKHITIKNCNVHTDVYGANPNSNNNRKGSIITSYYAEDINIIDTSIVFAGSSYTSVAIDMAGDSSGAATAKDFSIVGCYFESTNTTAAAYEMIMAYNNSGKFNFINNEVRVGISGYLIRLGYYKTTCTEINIIDNDFLGLGDLAGASIGANAIDSTNGMVWNVVGNNFEKLAPASFVFGTAGTTTLGCVFNYKYNFFNNVDATCLWNIAALGSIVVNHSNNLTLADYHANNVVDIKKNDNTFADKAALDAAYAEYKKTLYTVTYDVDGGNYILPAFYEAGKDVTLPTPEREGYVFGGWYDGETLVTKLSNKSYNLKAKWLVTYYVTFDTDGGNEVARVSFDTIGTVVLPYNVYKVVETQGTEGKKYADVAAIAADYIKDFKAYAGSNLADATKIDTSSIDSGSMVNMLKDAEMNAKWGWLYTALFVAAGSPEGMEYTKADDSVKGFYLANLCGFLTSTQHTDTYLTKQSADYSVVATSDAVVAAGPFASIFTNYVVEGWYEGETPVTAISELRNYNLKAKYAVAKTITFDVEGVAPIYFLDATKVTLPTATKDGYYFDGWYEGETPVTTIAEARDYNLTAKFRELKTLNVDPTAAGKVYADVAAIAAEFMADFNKVNGKTDKTIDNLATNNGESSWMKTMLEDATLLAKWTWLYKALATASSAPALNPETQGFTADGAKFLALANLYGFFHGEAHADPYSQSTMCADFSVAATSAAVVEAGPDKEAYATLAAAVAAAKDGDTIKIAAGDFDEEVTITQNNLTIIGAKAYDLEHDDTYTVGAEDTQIKKIIANGVKGLTIKNVVIKNRVQVENIDTLTMQSIYGIGGADGIVYVKGNNNDFTFKDFYYAGSGARIIYFSAGTAKNVTVDHLVVMDAATVTVNADGGWTAGICDAVRFGETNVAIADGIVTIKNSYIRAAQGGLMERDPNADKYVITNNYFADIQAPVYIRKYTVGGNNADLTKAINYEVTYNTFLRCGNSISDWDVVAITTGDNTAVNIHYNAFIESFTYNGKYMATDYVIKIRADKGDIDCANNYFKNLDEARFNNSIATGLTLIEAPETKDYAPQAYDAYKVMIVNKKVMIYGVNYEYVPAFVKLDEADEIEVAIGHYTLPTPTKEGYDFQGWFEGETKVESITEKDKHYVLVSAWENFSKFYNVEGITGFYTTFEAFRTDLLADYNAFAGKSFTFDTITDSKWTIISNYSTFFLANAAKYRPLVEYLANDGAATAPAWAALLALMDAGKTKAVNNEDGWKNDPYNYSLNYTVVGLVKAKLNDIHSSLNTGDFSNSDVQAAILALYKPAKAGYTFDGWFEDAAFATPATTIEKYGKSYYAKFTELPKYDVTLTLNGGTTYASTEEMMDAFVAAYAAHYGVTGVTRANWSDKMEATCGAGTWKYDDFFTAHPEWSWFKDFITALLAADELKEGSLSYTIDSKYIWRMGIQAYANATERTSWPKVTATSSFVTRSVDWTTYYNATTVVISQVYGTTKLPTAYKTGYTFAGWYDNAEFTGDAITSVTEAKTLYAKFDAVTPQA